MQSIEFDIICTWSSHGEYIPAVTNGPYENCYPAEYPDIELEKVFMDGSDDELKLTRKDFDIIEGLVIKEVEESEEPEDEISLTLELDCELLLEKTIVGVERIVKYNGQDVTEFIPQDYINELFS